MKRITMNIGTHGVETTAAEMRRRLAQTLSKIPGDQVVFFNLTLHLENYSPIPEPPRIPLSVLHPVLDELARPKND